MPVNPADGAVLGALYGTDAMRAAMGEHAFLQRMLDVEAALADAALDARLRSEWLDVTLPARPRRQGTIHPVSQVMEEVTAIFADMGFAKQQHA